MRRRPDGGPTARGAGWSINDLAIACAWATILLLDTAPRDIDVLDVRFT